jgi:hypothetical protein
MLSSNWESALIFAKEKMLYNHIMMMQCGKPAIPLLVTARAWRSAWSGNRVYCDAGMVTAAEQDERKCIIVLAENCASAVRFQG